VFMMVLDLDATVYATTLHTLRHVTPLQHVHIGQAHTAHDGRAILRYKC
jgi:hypothetical protein